MLCVIIAHNCLNERIWDINNSNIPILLCINYLELAKFELTDVVEVKTTADEAMAFSNSWRTYRERTDRLVRSRGKVYSLVLGQCTTVLLDKMKQDARP